MDNDNVKIVFCDCKSPEHLIIMEDWENEPYISVSYSLLPGNIFRRYIQAIKHILGFRSRYGDFGELLINVDEAKDLIVFLQNFVARNTDPAPIKFKYDPNTMTGTDEQTVIYSVSNGDPSVYEERQFRKEE